MQTKSHDEFAREVLLYARELYDRNTISLEFLGAVVVMCNKLIPADILNKIWEDVVKLDIFKYAEEHGKKEVAIEMLKDGMEKRQNGKKNLFIAIFYKFS